MRKKGANLSKRMLIFSEHLLLIKNNNGCWNALRKSSKTPTIFPMLWNFVQVYLIMSIFFSWDGMRINNKISL